MEPVWDFEDPPAHEETEGLPIDHAAIFGTLVPLLAMAMAIVTLLVKVAP